MKDYAAHTYDAKLVSVNPTVEFMNNVSRWFALMDISNCQQYIYGNHSDTRQFDDSEDSRLHWLEHAFSEYIEELNMANAPMSFLTKGTHNALVFTTVANVQIIRFLLDGRLKFVLTRKFSSDPIVSLFEKLRRSAS
ncbi:hypothetical protein HPB51_014041 [Rhipicephalus microplus]|uniref:Uncharacterized protein n=1 Tax=Rhipicephalus microplus TaxID=6941 RepID=A0A9J6EAW8_RHIMP|nr:hypothetical protein HPB51_014041 [Rhipicephalus microplus]